MLKPYDRLHGVLYLPKNVFDVFTASEARDVRYGEHDMRALENDLNASSRYRYLGQLEDGVDKTWFWGWRKANGDKRGMPAMVGKIGEN